ncbi:hypothetical protein [uncultured Dokdonia sp.]|uniref:hypothetical protein n=1 Tax=uncultured Dokdonia sp. TaxID=575653 RepID=UPI0030EE94D5
MHLYLNKTVEIYGYLVTAKNTGTSNGNRMCFGTFLDYNADWIDTVQFPPSLKKFPIQGKAVYKITGKVVAEFDFITIEVTTLERQHYRSDTKTTAFYNPKGGPKDNDNHSPFKLIK